MNNYISKYSTHIINKLLGTFILGFIGCCSVLISTVFEPSTQLFQIAIILEMGVLLQFILRDHSHVLI